MANKEKIKKQQKDKSKLEALRSLMSSFTLTVGAILVASVIIPKSPVASIESVRVFQTEIVYQVEVTDEDHALDLSTLKVVLDGQLEDYSYPLDLGMNVGVFDNLRPNTSYQLSIYGSKGFGQERLASMRVVTKANSGGAIISYELIDTIDYFLSYQVNVLLNDDEGLYSEVNLYYAYKYPDEEINFYEVIPIIDSNQIIELFDVPNEHTEVHLYLEATLQLGGTLILDELTFNVPFNLQTSFYLNQLTSSSLQYQFYKDYYYTDNVTYQAKLYFGHMLVKEQSLDDTSLDSHYHGSMIDFKGLKKNTDYKVIITSTYVNPYTKRTETKILHEEEIKTLGDYTVDYEITHYENYSEVYIFVNDPNHYFQIPYYSIYQIDDGQSFYLDGQSFSFTPDGNGKYVSFIIDHPGITPYQLIIGIRNQNDYTINQIIIDQLIEN